MKYLILILMCLSAQSFARPIEVRVRDYGWLTSIPVARSALDSVLNLVEDDINSQQPILDPRRVNYGAANSSVLASKGLGTDYVNDPKKFEISLGLGVAWDEERDIAIKDEISGAAAASGVSIGVRMEEILSQNIFGLDRKKLMGFLSFGSFRAGQSIPGRDVDIAGKIDSTNFSFHFRYDLWKGVKLHTGYEFNRNKVDFSTTLDEPVRVDTGGLGILEGRLTGQPTFEVETTTHSFPIEISNNINFLNFFNFFLGLGTDINLGMSKGKGKTKGDFSTLACSSGVCVGESVLPQLEAQANYDAQSQVRNVTFRAFGGVQLDLPFGLHVYGQASQMLGTKVIGASAGLRYVY